MAKFIPAVRGSLSAFHRGACHIGSGGSFGNVAIFSCSRGAAVSSSSLTQIISHDVSSLTKNNTITNSSRYFSSVPPPDKKSLLRMHAVSLNHSYYDDESEGDPRFNESEDGVTKTYLDPTDRREVEEEEERTWWLYDGTQESRDA